MNELQRQMYLSSLGVDTYMPRWHLPFAPQSLACELPVLDNIPIEAPVEIITSEAVVKARPMIRETSPVLQSPVNNLMGDILETKKTPKTNSAPINAADILAQLDTKPVSVVPFNLSIWRPRDGVMIIDSRNTKLALPTELFLSNILRSIFLKQPLSMQEEVLRWPMIENTFAKPTKMDARNELQTWLSVQQEIRPLHYLCLMGDNAASYFMREDDKFSDSLFKVLPLSDSTIKALILPSLNELLQSPSLKPQLFSATRRYFSQ